MRLAAPTRFFFVFALPSTPHVSFMLLLMNKPGVPQEETSKVESRAVVDPRTLSWLPWAVWLAAATGGSFLAACDRAGEKLAWWLGITSPKYYYEIQEALRMKVTTLILYPVLPKAWNAGIWNSSKLK